MELFTFHSRHHLFEEYICISPLHSWYTLFHTVPEHHLHSLPQLPLLHSLSKVKDYRVPSPGRTSKTVVGQGVGVRVRDSSKRNAQHRQLSQLGNTFTIPLSASAGTGPVRCSSVKGIA